MDTAQRPSLFRYAAPNMFYPLAGTLAPWFMGIAVVLTIVGLYLGFFVAPTDAVQGEVYRVIFIHVPAAWMSMFIYLVMAFWSAVGVVFNTRLSAMMAQALAPTGAMFCFAALWTGALWGRPTWGAYWVWDARLTSQLLLLFLYFGFMALTRAIEDPRRADKAGAILALVGAVNHAVYYNYLNGQRTAAGADKLAWEILLLLQTIGMNLFHGGRRTDDASDINVVEHALPLLKEVVGAYVRVPERRAVTRSQAAR